jgi:predicted DNA-binding ribbon-helix-helix protein
MAERSKAARAKKPPGAEWEQRILQLAGRRYSLRLEACYWEALEAIARRRRQRLNHLVAEMAQSRAPGANLASALRVLCIEELGRADLARQLAAERTSVLALVQSAPAPGLLLDAGQRIIAVNAAFAQWVGMDHDRLLGEPALRHFRFRTEPQFAVLWAGLGREWTEPHAARIVNIEPGRVLAANARLVPVITGRVRPLCLAWVLK